MKKNGFTLIELLTVIVIITVLSAAVITKYIDLVNNTYEAAAKNGLAAIRSAVSIYYTDQKFPPNDLSGLIPEYLRAIPEGYVPTASGNLLKSWNRNVFIPVGSSEYVDYSMKGQTDNSIDCVGHDGWAYDPGVMEVWIETKLTDTHDCGVHNW